MKHTFMIALFALAAPLALAQTAAPAERISDLSFVKAPPLLSCKADKVDIGRWDEAYAFDDEDIFVLRRGEDFYLLPLIGAPKPTRTCNVPGTGNLTVTGGVTFGKRLWLFCQPKTAIAGVPCAIDAQTGQKIDIDIPGADASVTRGAGIRSAISPYNGAAIFMVTNGPEKTWPCKDQALFFWFDLRSGTIRQLPIGWRLEFFSPDLATAVFATTQKQRDGRLILAAVSMRTGLDTAGLPDSAKDYWIPYSWNNTNRVQYVVTHRKPGNRDTAYVAGLAVDGTWYPFSLPCPDFRGYGNRGPEERNGRVVFRACRSENLFENSAPGWTLLLKKDGAPLELDARATDCAVTGARTGVFAAAGYGSKGVSTEAFAFDAGTKRAWNLLDGIQRLPALSPDDARKTYTGDRMSVQLLRGTGDRRHPGLVLCLYSHGQGDNRANIPGPGETRVPTRQWHHSVLVASDKRYETELFQEGFGPLLWLLNCGKLVFRDSEAPTESSGNAGAMRLYLVDFGRGSRS